MSVFDGNIIEKDLSRLEKARAYFTTSIKEFFDDWVREDLFFNEDPRFPTTSDIYDKLYTKWNHPSSYDKHYIQENFGIVRTHLKVTQSLVTFKYSVGVWWAMEDKTLETGVLVSDIII